MNTLEPQSRELMPFEQWSLLINASDSIADVKDIRDRAEAVRGFAKAAAKGLEMQNQAAELRIRAERKAGQLLSELPLRGGNRRSSAGDKHLNLGEMGITRHQSQTWQNIAATPYDFFEAYLVQCKASQIEITDAGLLRCAKAHSTAELEISLESGDVPFPAVSHSIFELSAKGARFGCLCVFPAWPMARGCGRGACNYDLQVHTFISELMRVPIGDVAAENSHLHLWSNSDRLSDAFRVCRHWGFTYRSMLVCKRSVRNGWGRFWRDEHDYLVLATKGNLAFRDNSLSSILDLGTASPSKSIRDIQSVIERVSTPPFLAVFGADSMAGWINVSGKPKAE